MEERFITIAVHTFSRAQVLKTRLEDEGVECVLKNVNLISSTISDGVKVRVLEHDLEKALRIVEKVNETYREEDESTKLESKRDVQRILVPIDFSDYSVNACKYALGLAEKLNAEIMLMHVYYNPILNSMPLTDSYYYQVNMDEVIRDIEIRAKENMANFYTELKEKIESENMEGVHIEYNLTMGIASDEIINYSEKYKPDVIIIGSRGKGDRENDLIGSVTARIIEETKVPVLVIPEDSLYQGISTINIMYATDFDDSDYRAIQKLMNILSPFNIRLYCTHIGSHDTGTIDSVKMKNLKTKIREEYNEYEIECDLIESNDIFNGIQEIIRAKNIDIISLVTHKRNLISRIFNPSLARKVLFHTNIPFLVFHANV